MTNVGEDYSSGTETCVPLHHIHK